MTHTAVRSRAEQLEELRDAVLRQVEDADGVAVGPELIREVSMAKDVAASRVAAAMWTLVDDGKLSYTDGGQLRAAT